MVQYLVNEQKADPKAASSRGRTVLHEAAKSGSLKLVQYLVEKGVDPKATDDEGKTVLHYATVMDNLELFKYLVETCNLDPTVKDSEGRDSFYFAKRHYRQHISDYLKHINEKK